MRYLFKNLAYLLFLFCLHQSITFAAEQFVIKDIRVEGLQRITPGTVFNYLPIKVGDTFDETRSAEAVRALFKTGFFKDVSLERDGDVLVFKIKERPAIASISLNGNKDIKSDALIDSLKQIGFAEGRIFNQSQLDKLEQELRRQYFSLGKYAVEVKSIVTPLEDNRVDITINISEGITAKIRQINIIGNEAFTEKVLLKKFKLTTPTMFSFFTKSDQYSREKLAADLESLKSYYLDHGYINFNVDSTQVSITPDKKDIYITINIHEGEQYFISGVKLAGNLVLPEEELFKQVKIKQGELFSRKDLTNTTEAINNSLGDIGYAFANVNAIPDINNDNKTVAVTFYIDPGQRAYVRRINFNGNTRTRDEVLRREMRQPEGGWISTKKVERGKVRLQRLGYFEDVNVETPAVPGTTDQVDVNYTVTEQPSGKFLAGVGFSQTSGIIFNTSISQDNFLGSGKRVSFDFNNSDINRRFGLGYTDPYWTVDGVSLGYNGYYRETNANAANLSTYDQTAYGGGALFGIPLTEYNSLRSSLSFEHDKLDIQSATAQRIKDFVAVNGNQYDILRFNNSFTYDSRNKAIFPDKGTLHSIDTEISLPSFGNSLEYYKFEYEAQWFTTITEDYILALKGDFGYANSYGSTNELPFFENFYAGGPKSVRGFRDNTLGPVDPVTGDRLGGNVKLTGGAEVILPVPFFRDIKSVRVTGFLDAGNVYDNTLDLGQLRYSAGLSGAWVSPFGIISASYAQPFNTGSNDDIQNFQFTFGTSF